MCDLYHIPWQDQYFLIVSNSIVIPNKIKWPPFLKLATFCDEGSFICHFYNVFLDILWVHTVHPHCTSMSFMFVHVFRNDHQVMNVNIIPTYIFYSLHDVMYLLFRLLSSCSLDWGNNPFTICLSEVCTVLFFPGYFSLALLCVKITILLIVEICPHNITVSHLFISTSIKKIGNFQLK